ncbi:MAG TPA: dolichyl-phosphate beta-glucosyltransferase [Anaerolineales bacterium]
MSKPLLSLIIPAHNEERRLPATLEQIFDFLQSQAYLSEVLVVENGSQDRTLEIAQDFARRFPRLRVITNTTSGKGRAVKRGMLEAWGEYRFMYDADASMPVAEINRFLPPVLNNCDIAIGSREAPGAVRYNEPPYRHLGGRLVNFLIRLLALPGLQDTQCGFKCFRAAAAEDLFRYQTLNGWSFDIELLFIARLRGYRIAEIPIDWFFNSESKLNAVQDAMKMVLDILQIRRNALRGDYTGRGQDEKV